ncbi:GGDEF domain-containing protein [Anaeroselena agilis]|uniref:GGDEF domain-containing protein n=1 Tax=Anaeroselena agilis TaxID=3063788 RepID=A0ABU3NTF5_9FIRM|nr:GGDEF domain-containing protein [Selenomonadales bacterium 4137-cl]
MQVFCRYAPLILVVLGTMVGLTGYYLDMVLRVSFERLLWLGATLLLALAGLITGRMIQRLNLSSLTDFTTGLWNRRYFYLRLDEEEARATKKKAPLCVAMIDVDGFKAVNDTYGHAAGDLLLSDLAAIFKKNTRATDVVARWGGDEFAIIFSETSIKDAHEVIERIRQKVEAKFSSSYDLTISAGVISLEPNQDIRDLLIKADKALYKAKEQKNSVITITEFIR